MDKIAKSKELYAEGFKEATEFAIENSPYKVGDIVMANRWYSNWEKNYIKCVVSKVMFCEDSTFPQGCEIACQALTKSGSVARNINTFWIKDPDKIKPAS